MNRIVLCVLAVLVTVTGWSLSTEETQALGRRSCGRAGVLGIARRHERRVERRQARRERRQERRGGCAGEVSCGGGGQRVNVQEGYEPQYGEAVEEATAPVCPPGTICEEPVAQNEIVQPEYDLDPYTPTPYPAGVRGNIDPRNPPLKEKNLSGYGQYSDTGPGKEYQTVPGLSTKDNNLVRDPKGRMIARPIGKVENGKWTPAPGYTGPTPGPVQQRDMGLTKFAEAATRWRLVNPEPDMEKELIAWKEWNLRYTSWATKWKEKNGVSTQVETKPAAPSEKSS